MGVSWYKWFLGIVLGLALAGAIAALAFGKLGFIFVPIVIGPFWRLFKRDGAWRPPFDGGPIHPR